MTLKIDKNVPLPKQDEDPRATYPWKEMAVGDSFFIPGRQHTNGLQVPPALRKAGFGILRRLTSEDGNKGVRVWRVS